MDERPPPGGRWLRYRGHQPCLRHRV